MKKVFALVLSLVMVLSLAACGGAPKASYKEGTYEGTAAGFGGDLKVSVKVAGDKISSVEVLSHSETDGIGTNAVDALPGKIVEKQTADVDAVSGATVTSKAITEAVKAALANAK